MGSRGFADLLGYLLWPHAPCDCPSRSRFASGARQLAAIRPGPKELRRARALENGFYLAACNRTGIDRIMDCRQAPSLVCDPSGNIVHEGTTEGSENLFLLPPFAYSETSLEKISGIAREKMPALYCAVPITRDNTSIFSAKQGNSSIGKYQPIHWAVTGKSPRFDFGPARVHLVYPDMLFNPEPAVAEAKQGCDIVLLFNHEITPEHHLLADVRTIENIAVAACSLNAAGIWITPEGHQRWDQVSAEHGEVCRYPLDTHRTRLKRFQDRIDFDVLLR